jgi:hypothetical protein
MPLDAIQLEHTVRGTLSAELTTISIVALDVQEDVDHDGDPILRIRVTFRNDGSKLETTKVKGLIRHLRSALAEADESRFPVISFQVENEANGEPSEAA